jgi:low affinity Fe/Cu permease
LTSCWQRLTHWFSVASERASEWVGSPPALMVACAMVLIWAAFGPPMGFSDTWQLIINTPTTILTFLLLFLLQASQNNDTKALHAKIDELIRVNSKARDELIGMEKQCE